MNRDTHRHSGRLIAWMAVLAMGLAAISCTREQEREDEQPTEEQTQQTDQQQQAEQAEQEAEREAEQRREQAEQEAQQQQEQAEEVELTEVMDSPDEYQGRRVQTEGTIQTMISASHFMIGESEDESLFAGLPQTEEAPDGLKQGQRVRVEGRFIARDQAENMLGPQLDPRAERRLEDKEFALLVTNADDIEMVEQPPQAQRDQQGQEGEDKTITIGGEDYETFADWDGDDDGTLTRGEFTDGIEEQNVFSDLDADGDDELGQQELYEWTMQTWDADDNDELSEQEFTRVSEQWTDVEWGSFDQWDADGDGTLTSSEFETGAAETDLYGMWDVDGNDTIGQEDFAECLFDAWDADGNNILSADEAGFDQPDEGVTLR